MKIGDIINEFNEIEPSVVSDRAKVRWIGTVDYYVRNNIYAKYTDDECAGWTGYDVDAPDVFEHEAIIPDAYCSIYQRYMAAQNDLINGDTERYQNHMIAYNAAWENFVNEYNRTHTWKR